MTETKINNLIHTDIKGISYILCEKCGKKLYSAFNVINNKILCYRCRKNEKENS